MGWDEDVSGNHAAQKETGGHDAIDEDFPIIEDPSKWVGRKVHVDGWKIGCVFVLISTNEGVHVLQMPKTKKVYTTRNKLRNSNPFYLEA